MDELKFNVQVQVWTNIPLINIPASLTGYVGKAFSHVVDASDGPSRFSVAGLPEGLSIDPVTGEIRGIPTGTGTFPIEVSAQNASAPPGLGKFTLRIVRGTPEIRTAPTALALRSGQPLSASSLLRGEATNALGVVAGKFSWLIPDRRPAAGTSLQKVRFYPADLTLYQPAVISIPIEVLGITSDLSALTLTNGVAPRSPYVLQANVSRVRFKASGLPPGLRLDPRTGILSGRPTRSGTFTVTFQALQERGGQFAGQKTFTVIPRTAMTYLDQALSFLNSQPMSP